MDRSLAITSSLPVQEAAMRILSALVSSCVSYFPVDQYAAPGHVLEETSIEVMMMHRFSEVTTLRTGSF